jgi:hypothetical protein
MRVSSVMKVSAFILMILLVLPTVPSSHVSHFFLCDAENKFAKGKEQDDNKDNNNEDKENSRGDVKPCFKKAKVSTTVASNSAALGFHKKLHYAEKAGRCDIS